MHGRSRFAPDFSTDDMIQSLELVTNGVWIPGPGIQFSRISRLHSFETGPLGECVSVIPFALAYKTSSFVPSQRDSAITEERKNLRLTDGDSYCFLLDADADTLELKTHNALVSLSKRMTAGYAVPLFYRRRVLNTLRKGSSDTLARRVSPDREGYGLATVPILSECAFISPNESIEKSESQVYISYTRNGDAAVHLPDLVRPLNQEPFILGTALTQIAVSRNEEDLSRCAEDLLEMLPDLFGQSWSSRKVKHIVESAMYEHIDEREKAATSSVKKTLEAFPASEKIAVVEKVLRRHLGIVLYFRIRFRR